MVSDDLSAGSVLPSLNLNTVIIVSVVVLICTSLFVLFICTVCNQKSMDYEFDANNVQVIYNPSAGGARDLPFTDTYGVYRNSANNTRRGSEDFVIFNPAVTALPVMNGQDNDAFVHSFTESNNNGFYRDPQEKSITFHNLHFENRDKSELKKY